MSDLTPSATNGNQETQFLAFRVEDREYALNLTNVVQIIRLVSLRHTPTPDSVEGMFNLRGRKIPVVDIRQKCGLPQKASGVNTPLVITRSNGHVVALTVDAVSEVLTLSQSKIEPLATSQPIQAIGRIQDRALFILDPNALLPPLG